MTVGPEAALLGHVNAPDAGCPRSHLRPQAKGIQNALTGARQRRGAQVEAGLGAAAQGHRLHHADAQRQLRQGAGQARADHAAAGNQHVIVAARLG